jgi:histidine triad (HIT) family protein
LSQPEGIAEADPDCLFCKIVAGEIPSEKVTETDGVLAFRDINPGAPTHVLVIPKNHIASAHEMTRAHAGLLGELFEVIAQVATHEGVGDGYRVVTNIGTKAGQSVFHVHFHVLGGRPLEWPPG